MKQLFSILLFGAALHGTLYATDFTSGHAPGFGNVVARKGLWSAVGNPAGLTAVKHLEAGFFYRNQMFLDELSIKGVALAFPIAPGTPVAFGLQRFGYHLYNQTRFNCSLARRFGEKVDAGISFDYLNYTFGNEYGSVSLITATAGLNFNLSKQIYAGVMLSAPADIYTFHGSDELLKTNMAAAIGWSPGSHLVVSAGVSKVQDQRHVFALDIHYRPYRRFDLIAGISSDLTPFYFGYSFQLSKIRIGMVSGYHFQLGFTPQITLSYSFKNFI